MLWSGYLAPVSCCSGGDTWCEVRGRWRLALLSLGADDDEHWSLVSSAGAAVTRELRDLLFLCLTKIKI